MSRTLTTKDCHALMNELVKQATGQKSIAVVDTSSFVSAGEKVLATGMENVFNSLNIVLGRTIVASRPYSARLTLMRAENTGVYTSRMRKISFYADEAVASGVYNTDMFTNLAEGFTNGQNLDSDSDPQSTKSMWEQKRQKSVEFNFGGSSAWDNGITLYEVQVQNAFRSESDFAQFIAGYLTEHANDIQSQIEAWNRMVMLNKIGQVYDMSSVMPGSVVNLTTAFNSKFGTNYTSAELRTTYLKDFLAFFVAEFKLTSKYMTERSANYHWSVPVTEGDKTYNVLRHTPYASQRVYLYAPLFTEAESYVMPQIFNPEYLDIKTQYQEITYWQNENSRASVKVIPAIVNTSTGVQAQGDSVDIPFVVGMICDKDAMMTDVILETSATTPLEARKLYRTTWNHYCKNAICDPTENTVLFIMAD